MNHWWTTEIRRLKLCIRTRKTETLALEIPFNCVVDEALKAYGGFQVREAIEAGGCEGSLRRRGSAVENRVSHEFPAIISSDEIDYRHLVLPPRSFSSGGRMKKINIVIF